MTENASEAMFSCCRVVSIMSRATAWRVAPACPAESLPVQDSINRRELVLKALAGLIGGAIGWIPVEIVSHGHTLTEQQSTTEIILGMISMALVSGLIGGMVTASNGTSLRITPQTRRHFVRGFLICLVLGAIANHYSDLVFSYMLAAGGWGINHQGSIGYMIAGRVLAWTMMGAMLGAGVGIASLSLGNVLKGAIGGTIGGFVGGAAFDIIGGSTSGLTSRLLGFSVLGLAIGLFIGLVQELTKAAWLRVEAGRLRGREYRLERATAILGRAEESDVGLFGDPGVVARHARIDRSGATYTLKDLSIQQGTYLNGERVESAQLREGDRIKLGNYELAFHLKGGAAGSEASRPAIVRSTPVAPSTSAAAARAADPYLVDAQGRRIMLRAEAATRVGRALDNDVVVEHASVSRHHAALAASNGGFELRDLNSQNGTWVGGRRITETMLRDGDSIRFGDAEYTFRS